MSIADEKAKKASILDRSLVFISVASLIGIVLINILNVVARFTINTSLFWGLEVCSILAVWFTFIVFGINYKDGQHFKIDLVVNSFKGKLKKAHGIFVDIILLVILGFTLYSSIVSYFRNYQMTLPATEVPSSIALYLPLIIGSLTYVFFIIMKYAGKIGKRP